MRTRYVAVVLLGSCGRIAFDDIHDAPFAPPTRVDELSSAAEDDDPTLTADLLEVYFVSGRTGNNEIYRAVRSNTASAWEPPTIVSELMLPTHDITPDITADGLMMHFTRLDDIYVTTRGTRAEPWGPPTVVSELATSELDHSPSLSADRLVLVFARGNPPETGRVFVTSRATPQDPWRPPVAVVELDDPSRGEGQGWLGEGVYYFTSTELTKNQDIMIADRNGMAFSTSRPLAGFAEPDRKESDPWLSADERVMFFEIDNDIYVTTR